MSVFNREKAVCIERSLRHQQLSLMDFQEEEVDYF